MGPTSAHRPRHGNHISQCGTAPSRSVRSGDVLDLPPGRYSGWSAYGRASRSSTVRSSVPDPGRSSAETSPSSPRSAAWRPTRPRGGPARCRQEHREPPNTELMPSRTPASSLRRSASATRCHRRSAATTSSSAMRARRNSRGVARVARSPVAGGGPQVVGQSPAQPFEHRDGAGHDRPLTVGDRRPWPRRLRHCAVRWAGPLGQERVARSDCARMPVRRAQDPRQRRDTS